MKKWLPSLLPILSLIGLSFAPTAQEWVGHHPVLATSLGVASAVINHVLPQPQK